MWGATAAIAAADSHGQVSIHAPRVGCDGLIVCRWCKISRFQFTHPVWGATKDAADIRSYYFMFQFTHPVWGATASVLVQLTLVQVSIHAPRVGCDETLRHFGRHRMHLVSIHAPRVGCDYTDRDSAIPVFRVSIHAPRVGCDVKGLGALSGVALFQFTHPVWGATGAYAILRSGGKVSIHAPRVGCDP